MIDGSGALALQATRPPALGHVLACSARSKTASLAAGAPLLLACTIGSLKLLVLACLIYAAIVLWQAARPRFWAAVRAADAEELRRLPDPFDLTEPSLRAVVMSIHEGREEVRRVLARTPRGVRPYFATVASSLDALEAQAAIVIRYAEQLARFERASKRDSVLCEIRRLRELAVQTDDLEARRDLERAREIRQQQLGALDRVRQEHQRLQAQLSRVVATIEGLPAQILRLQVLDVRATVAPHDALDQELGRVRGELRAAQHLFESLGEPSAG